MHIFCYKLKLVLLSLINNNAVYVNQEANSIKEPKNRTEAEKKVTGALFLAKSTNKIHINNAIM